MGNALRELLAVFDIKVDDAPLRAADKQVANFTQTLKGVGTAIATYFAVDQIREFVGSAIEMGASIDDTAQRLGVGTEELQQFQYAVTLSGGSIEDANQALRFFSKNLGEATSGNADAAQAFAKLGVNIRDANGDVGDTMDMLGGVAEGFAHLKTDGERTAMAMQLFGRGGAALIPLLKQGQAGVAALAAQFNALGGGLDGETIQALAQADDEIDRLSFSGKALKAELVAALVPALRAVTQEVTAGVAWFRDLAKNSYIVQTAMWSLAAVAGVLAIAWAALNVEVLLAVAGIALFILAVDDLYTWLQGGDSVIGEFIDALFGEGKSDELLKELAKDYDDIKASVDDASDAVNAMVDAVDALADATGIDVSDVMSSAWKALLFQIRAVSAEVKLVSNVIEWVAEKATKLARLPGAAKDLLGGSGPLAALAGAAGLAPTVAGLGGASSSTTDNSTNSTNLTAHVTIHGATNPEATGNAAGNAVTDALLDLRGAFAGALGGG